MGKSGVKIVLTGGHAATVGVAVVEEIRRKLGDLEIFWIGEKYAFPGEKTASLESRIMPELGVTFCPIPAGKLQTKFTRHTISLLLKIPLGFIRAYFLIFKIHPRVILSFGGYSSLPVVFWGWIFGIPVILHEQTAAAGRAAIASAFFSKKIALAGETSTKYFPPDKSVVIGNPVMQSILEVKPKDKISGKKTILVMGGSRGSQFINEELAKDRARLTEKFNLIHITGESEFSKYKKFEGQNYKPVASVDPRNMYSYYEKADVIISRSGANSVSEIIAVKRPAILIPLPRTFLDEQRKNAEFAEKFGVAEILTEEEVASRGLYSAVTGIFEKWNAIVKRILPKASPDEGASGKLVDVLGAFL